MRKSMTPKLTPFEGFPVFFMCTDSLISDVPLLRAYDLFESESNISSTLDWLVDTWIQTAGKNGGRTGEPNSTPWYILYVQCSPLQRLAQLQSSTVKFDTSVRKCELLTPSWEAGIRVSGPLRNTFPEKPVGQDQCIIYGWLPHRPTSGETILLTYRRLSPHLKINSAQTMELPAICGLSDKNWWSHFTLRISFSRFSVFITVLDRNKSAECRIAPVWNSQGRLPNWTSMTLAELNWTDMALAHSHGQKAARKPGDSSTIDSYCHLSFNN